MFLVTAEEQSEGWWRFRQNYSAQPLDKSPQYQSYYEERLPPGTLAHMVQRKEAITARRETLFDIDYGPASLYKNDSGMIVKPVSARLPPYFELVRMLTDERPNVQHYLDHECFILGIV